jgi:hypothetical protein
MHQTQFLWVFISYLARRPWLSSLSPVRNARFEVLNSNCLRISIAEYDFFYFITADNTSLALIQIHSAAFHGVSAVKMVEYHVNVARSYLRPLEPLPHTQVFPEKIAENSLLQSTNHKKYKFVPTPTFTSVLD